MTSYNYSISKHSLTFVYTNLRSIKNKVEELNTTISHLNLDMFCLVETWLTPDVPDGFINLSEYNLYRKDRQSRGGNVLIGCKKILRVKSLSVVEDDEISAVDIYDSNKKFVQVIVAYNPNFNNTCKLKSLLKTLTSLIVSEEEVLIGGDFNLPKAFQLFPSNTYESQYKLFSKLLIQI